MVGMHKMAGIDAQISDVMAGGNGPAAGARITH
jgi:hypothetical protein